MHRRASFIESVVRPLGFVKPNSVFDDAFGLEPVLQFMQVDSLLFRGPPQPFDEDVIKITAPPIRRNFDIRVSQNGDPG